MAEYCYLCGKFVEITPDRVVWGLSQPSSEEFELVCDRCVNNKLNFGEPGKGGCLYCDDEPDYNLRRYGVSAHTAGYSFFAKRGIRPIVCAEHLEKLDESDQDRILSIDDTLTSEDQLQPPGIQIPEAIGQEEGQHLEYKETFQYDVYNDKQRKDLKSNVTDEVAAFGNSEGGVVVIGVRDSDKEVTGLNRDYQSMNGKWDGFALQVGDVISSNIGEAFAASCTSIQQHQIEGTDICAIYVDPSPNALFTADNEFYVRQGNSSQPLKGEEMAKYISNHWKT